MSYFDLPGDEQELDDPNGILTIQESGYIAPDVDTDQTTIQAQVFANLAARVSGWQQHDGNLDTWIVEAFSEVGAEIRALARDVPSSIFGTYGTRILNVPPRIATAATGVATFIAVDDKGYTLDTGTTFALPRSGNDLVAYQTLQPAVIAVGATEVDNVPFAAVETGYDSNGLSGDGVMLDAITWVGQISVPFATADGQDAEDPDAYVSRLANLFPAVALRPILPLDFAILALQLIPGVGRAVAMNLYDPATGTWDNVRTVTLIVTDPNGQPLPAGVKQQVEAMLEALREINWVVHVIDPDYTAVAVEFDVVAYAGQDATTVHDNAVADVTAYLQPALYRLGEMSPAIAGGEVIFPPEDGLTSRQQFIYVNELIALLDRTMGVDRVISVTINGEAADFQLPGPSSLPTPGEITGAVEGANP